MRKESQKNDKFDRNFIRQSKKDKIKQNIGKVNEDRRVRAR